VRNIPEDSTIDAVKEILEATGAVVSSIVFDGEAKEGKRIAVVRFSPLPPPWTLTPEQLAIPVLTPIPEPEPEPEVCVI
jgi:hypothetical protein